MVEARSVNVKTTTTTVTVVLPEVKYSIVVYLVYCGPALLISINTVLGTVGLLFISPRRYYCYYILLLILRVVVAVLLYCTTVNKSSTNSHTLIIQVLSKCGPVCERLAIDP